MAAPRIRRATPADAQVLARLAADTFVETFGHLYPAGDLQAYLDGTYTVERQRRILASPVHAVWLVERDGVAVGHAAAGPCGLPHPQARPDHGELKRLYLRRGEQGAGLGSQLLLAALDWLERDGARPLWVGVWSQNHGAQRLYARHGFEYAGRYEFPVGRVRDDEFIMRRLPDPAGTDD